jgi:hypothetical protein
MASDADWVEDVRRWCFAGLRRTDVAVEPPGAEESDVLGYEAAYPPLQASSWPDAPTVPTASGAAP